MRKDIKNIEASVRGQLQNKAKETDRPFAEVLQYFGMERFLLMLSRKVRNSTGNGRLPGPGNYKCAVYSP